VKIPKTLKIGGKTVRINLDGVRAAKQCVNGTAYYDHNEILLDDYKRSVVSQENIEQTLIHEVVHFINAMLSRQGTDCDAEEYVNPMSELLYQVIKQLKE